MSRVVEWFGRIVQKVDNWWMVASPEVATAILVCGILAPIAVLWVTLRVIGWVIYGR
jgi:hypothetical protein